VEVCQCEQEVAVVGEVHRAIGGRMLVPFAAKI
jgi:hypothetical protein